MAPAEDLDFFFNFTSELGLKYIEVRNDLPGNRIYDHKTPGQVKELAEKYDITVLTINALQQFNRAANLDEKLIELQEMINLAKQGGCQGIVLCPVNDPDDSRTDDESLKDTITALNFYGKFFAESGIIGLVEPLGFSICSIRTKRKAVKAIENCNYPLSFKIVHDTFHHYLAGENEIFPEHTGLVHISGVEDNLAKEEINDGHRLFIGQKDIMNNVDQISRLVNQGYEGVFSFEPFGPAVQNLPSGELKTAIQESIQYLSDNVK